MDQKVELRPACGTWQSHGCTVIGLRRLPLWARQLDQHQVKSAAGYETEVFNELSKVFGGCSTKKCFGPADGVVAMHFRIAQSVRSCDEPLDLLALDIQQWVTCQKLSGIRSRRDALLLFPRCRVV